MHPEVVDTKHSVKEHSGAPNKRNTRKKRNRNVSVGHIPACIFFQVIRWDLILFKVPLELVHTGNGSGIRIRSVRNLLLPLLV